MYHIVSLDNYDTSILNRGFQMKLRNLNLEIEQAALSQVEPGAGAGLFLFP